MICIVDGKRYNTEKAEKIAHARGYYKTLYLTPKGNWFVVESRERGFGLPPREN